MAANFKKGRLGRLKDPIKRRRLLMSLAHLTLAEAGRRLGLKTERARQLYRIYGIVRKSHRSVRAPKFTTSQGRTRRAQLNRTVRR